MALGKYEFNNKQEALDKVKGLGVDEEGNPTHNHTVVMLGFLALTQGTYSEEGEVITEPILSEKYAVDVLWNKLEKHPHGWGVLSINVKNPKHSFLGVDNNTQL